MQTEYMLQADLSMPPTLNGIEQNQEQEFAIARDDRSTDRLGPEKPSQTANRIGVAKDLFTVPDNIDSHNIEVSNVFLSEASS